MAVRSLAIDIATQANTRALETANAKTDEFKETTQEATHEVDSLGQETTRFGDTAGRVGRFVVDNAKMIGGAFAGAGGAVQGLLWQQQDLIESSERLASMTDLTSEGARDLAADMSDATLSIQDAYDLMGIGRQQGLESEEQLRDFTETWDMVGDATGENAAQLAEAGIALRTMGLEAGEEKEAFDAFGFVLQDTTSGVGDFLHLVERTAPELREMQMDVDDTAAVLGAMEGELGMAGRTARQELRQGIRDADGDMSEMLDTIGITEEQFKDYRAEVDQAGGTIQELADIHGESRTRVQELYADFQAFTHTHVPGLVDALDILSPVLMGASTVMMGFAAAKWAGVGAAATFGLTIAGVTAPLWAVLGAAAAVGGGIYYLVTRVDTVREFFSGLWDTLSGFASYLASGVAEAWREQKGIIGGVAQSVEGIIGTFTALGTAVGETVSFLVDHWRDGETILGRILHTIGNTFGIVFNTVYGIVAGTATAIWGIFTGDFEPLTNIVGGITDSIKERWHDMTETMTSLLHDLNLFEIGSNLIGSLVDGVRDSIGAVGEAITDVGETIQGGITDFFGISSPAQLTMEYGHNIAEGMGQGMEQGAEDVDRGAQRMYEPATEAPAPQPRRTTGEGFTQNNYIEINVTQRDGERIDETTRRGLRDVIEDEIEQRYKKLRYKIQAGEV